MNLLLELEALLLEAKIKISSEQKQQLIGLIELLVKWNKTYNLTAIRDPQEMLIKHLMDSLVVSEYLDGNVFIDVGTGPGFPGLPLAIINPNKKFVLLDSLGKRINFIKHVIRELNIKNVTPVKKRVEEYTPEELFDGIISRAFASLDDMLLITKHLISNDGYFYALKGIISQPEMDKINNEFLLQRIIKLNVPELNAERNLVILSKN